jgi:glycosyltransferase involved in cell wall biosynthesis
MNSLPNGQVVHKGAEHYAPAGPDVSIVIPVYRSASTLPELVVRMTEVLSAYPQTYEIVLIDDGSPDHSWEVVSALQQKYAERIVAIRLMRNYGQHNAVMCGFRRCRGRLVITMDDDLQNPPEEVPKLIQAIEREDFDLVYGVYNAKKHGLWRNVGSALVTGFYRLVFHSNVTITSFRAIRRQLVETTFAYNLNFTFIDGMLAWNTQRIGQVAVVHQPRSQGRSGYSLAKLAVLALNLFTNFSLLPLQLVSGCGVLTAGLGLMAATYYFIQYLCSNISVPGYASIIIAVLVLGGLQLLALGIMGEYLGRLHLNVNHKPQYFERQILGASANTDRPAVPGTLARSEEKVTA